ncbi:regulator of late gene expression [Salmonella enterica]|nr:regulator of late gene expression [Salmonella enterica]
MKTCWFLIVPTPTGAMQSAQQKCSGKRLQRGVASFSLQLAEGRADLYTEMPVKVTGFKQPIDDAEWTITTLTHSVSPDNGFTTSMELEVKIDGLEIE